MFLRSAPEQKASVPAPVRISTSSASSALNASTASNSSPAVSPSTQLRTSGRLIDTTNARPRRSVRTLGIVAQVAQMGHRISHGWTRLAQIG